MSVGWRILSLTSWILLLSRLSVAAARGQEPANQEPAHKAHVCEALFSVAQGARPDPAEAPRRRALLVGISRYQELGSKNGDWPNLPTRCDVEAIKQILVGRYSFAPEEVKVLTEGQAEGKNIVDLFRTHLIERARPGDVVVFYFSGHGQRIPDPRSWGGLRGSLVTANYIDGDARNGARTNLRSDTLRDLLRELKARMRNDPKDPNSEVIGNITVLLDACYSGGGTKGFLKPKGRAWDPARDGPIPEPETGVRAKGAAGFFDKEEAVAQGYVLVAASNSEQPALAPMEGTEVSLMTYHLAELLAQASPQATYRDIFERLGVGLSAYQSPQLEGRSNQRLFAAADRTGEVYLPVQKVEGSKIILPVGRVQGATKGSRFALFRAGASVKDPKNKVAEVEIEAVRTTTSVARPTPEHAGVKPKDLEAARAVEVLHNYGEHRLRVYFDQANPPAGVLRGENDVLTTDGATKDAYDVRVRREGGAWMLERPSKEAHEAPGRVAPSGGGLVLARIKDDTDVVAGIREALAGEWRYQFLARRLKRSDPEGALDIEVKLIPWDVQENDQGEPVSVGPRDGFDTSSQITLRPNDYVAIFVRNYGRDPVYITVLDLGTDGSIRPVFPPAGAPPIEQFAPARIMPGKDWERLRGQVVQLEEPAGQEIFKVIATKQPADFSGFLYIPKGVRDKGDTFEKIPAKFKPLALLMTNVMAGQKGNPVSLEVDWCTAEAVVEVRKP